jgi:hypothetical protein
MSEPNSLEASDRVGSKLLFENDRVRVWDFVMQPGERSSFHSHKNDYLFIYVTPDNKIEVVTQPGPTLLAPNNFVSYYEVGDEPPLSFTHQVKNVADSVHRQIVVELLGPSRSRTAQPVATNANSSGERWETPTSDQAPASPKSS